jgi:hypothetical protein
MQSTLYVLLSRMPHAAAANHSSPLPSLLLSHMLQTTAAPSQALQMRQHVVHTSGLWPAGMTLSTRPAAAVGPACAQHDQLLLLR